MARIKRSVVSRARRKKILDMAKGYRGSHSKNYRDARQHVENALLYQYRDRRRRKREFRSLWIMRINAGARLEGLTYGRFMEGLRKSGIELDRKVLADLAVHSPDAFTDLAAAARTALGQS